MENNTHGRKFTRSKIVMGSFLVIIGSLLLLKQQDLNVPSWLTIWPTALIGAGIASGVIHRFQRPGAYIAILVGTVFLTDRLVPGHQIQELLFPLLITALGIILIVRRNHPFSRQCRFKMPGQQ